MKNSRPKILLGHNYYQKPGGEDTIFSAETTLLRERGHIVLEYIENNSHINSLSKIDVAFQTFYSLPTQRKLRNILEKETPDIVHFHNTFLLISPSAYFTCREYGIPVVQTLHNYRLTCSTATFFRNGRVCTQCLDTTFPYPAVVHGCYHNSRAETSVVATMHTFHRLINTWQKKVDLYIALTKFARQKFIQAGIPEHKITIKPNFIYPDPGEHLRERKERFAIFVGRLVQEKGVLTLLKAWGNLSSIKLKIIGDGPLMETVRSEIQQKDLKDIDLLGWLPHSCIMDFLKSAYVLVFPSEWFEGLPTIILEAFACSLPVIASRLGTMQDVVDNHVTGLHFEPGSSKELAEKVQWVWDNPLQVEKMSKEARQEYERDYTAEKNYQMLTAIYNSLIA